MLVQSIGRVDIDALHRRASIDPAGFDTISGDPDIAARQQIGYAGADTATKQRCGVDFRARRSGGELLGVVDGDDRCRPRALRASYTLPRAHGISRHQRGRQREGDAGWFRETHDFGHHDRSGNLDFDCRVRNEPKHRHGSRALIRRRKPGWRKQRRIFLELQPFAGHILRVHCSAPYIQSFGIKELLARISWRRCDRRHTIAIWSQVPHD